MRRPCLLAILFLWALSGPVAAQSFASWSAKAQKAEKADDAEAALQAWSNAIRLWKPADGKKGKAKAFAARASLKVKAGKTEAAVKDLSEAVGLDAKDPRLFHRRGRLHLDLGRAKHAITDFYKATALDLSFGEAFFDRGRAYEMQGDDGFAREDFKQACSLKYKKGCDKVRPAKAAVPKKKKPTPKAEAPADEPPAPAAPPGESPVPAAAPAPESDEEEDEYGAKAPVDAKACVSGIEACADESGLTSFGSCVAKVKPCEESPKNGCCPRECLLRFTKALGDKSEAQAFRETFSLKSDCFR